MRPAQDKPVTVRVSFSVDIDRPQWRKLHPRLSHTRLSQLRSSIRQECERVVREHLESEGLLADEG